MLTQKFFAHYEDQSRIAVDITTPSEATPFMHALTHQHIYVNKALRKRYTDTPINPNLTYQSVVTAFSPENGSIMRNKKEVAILTREITIPTTPPLPSMHNRDIMWSYFSIQDIDGRRHFHVIIPTIFEGDAKKHAPHEDNRTNIDDMLDLIAGMYNLHEREPDVIDDVKVMPDLVQLYGATHTDSSESALFLNNRANIDGFQNTTFICPVSSLYDTSKFTLTRTDYVVYKDGRPLKTIQC